MVCVHPGRVLKRELVARELSANKLAFALRVPSGRITAILNAKRAITPETALRLGRYFGNSAQFWMNLQTRYDLNHRPSLSWVRESNRKSNKSPSRRGAT